MIICQIFYKVSHSTINFTYLSTLFGKYYLHFLDGNPRVKTVTSFVQAQRAGSNFKLKYIGFKKSVLLMFST